MVRREVVLEGGRVSGGDVDAELALYELAGFMDDGAAIDGEYVDAQGYQITVQVSVNESVVYHIPD